MWRWLLPVLFLGCAAPAPPRERPADPTSLLPEKRLVLYWKRGCEEPEEHVSEVFDLDQRPTILWKAECADGRVLRCSYRRLLKCRFERDAASRRAAVRDRDRDRDRDRL